ncbi:MAG: hypothetical protein L6Q54_13155 [Leptospiraceae bacterium]|nr:hypothetical protein [Leptospiraceae bacterium]MCK6382182.1 hypothetical protein [Leptospiraceae bacterium]NUM42530.1 hypothetical protein [Leptospiraceae bacterium]
MYKKIIFLLIIIIPLFSCKKKVNHKEPIFDESYYKSLQGTWDVSPSAGKKIIFNGDKKAILIVGGNPIPLNIQMDSYGMRLIFLENEKAFGYFVHSEKKESVWVGVLEDEVVKLSKVKEENSSVLE